MSRRDGSNGLGKTSGQARTCGLKRHRSMFSGWGAAARVLECPPLTGAAAPHPLNAILT